MMKQDEVAKAAWHGMIWRFLERCSSQVVSFIVSIILARLLLPEQYGIIAMTMIFIALSEVFVTSGLGSALIQRSKYDELEFSTMFWASLLFSFLLYALLFLAAPGISLLMKVPALTIVLRVLGLRLPISAMNSIQQAYVSQQMIFKKFFFSTLSGTFFSGIIGLFMAYQGLGVWALVGQNISMVVINTVVLHFLIPWRPALSFSKTAFQRLYGFSWRLMASSFMGTLFEQLRSFLIGRYYSPADLAFANRGEQFPMVISNNVSASVQSVLFPAFSHLKENQESVRHAVQKAMIIGSFVICGLMSILAGISDTLVTIILTEKWLDCIPYLQWSCLGQCFGILSMINLQTISALGRADIVLKLEFVKKPFWFIILLIGVQFSPLAVIAGNALYGIISFTLNSIPNRKLLKYGVGQQIKDIIGPFFISGLLFFILQKLQVLLPRTFLFLIIEGFLGMVGYFFIGRMFRINGAEYVYAFIRERIKNVRRKLGQVKRNLKSFS